MRLRLLPALSMLTILEPCAHGAVTVADEDLTVTVGMDMEVRAQAANASNAAGGSYDAFREANGKSNDVDMNVRRARLFLAGTYGADWRFNLSLNADNVDRNGDNSPTQSNSGPVGAAGTSNQITNYNSNREVTLFKAYLDRLFQIDDADLLVLHGGLDFAFFNRAVANNPWWLFPQQRASGNLMGNRSVGARVLASGERYDWGVDVMESMDPNKDATNANRREGLFYSSRLEVTAFTDGRKPLYHEDYQGKPGHTLLLAADVGLDDNDYGQANTRIDALSYGFEALLHWDALSALIEVRSLHTKENSYNGAGTDSSIASHVLVAQAGYAIPLWGIQVEPALRFQLIDMNTHADEQDAFNSGTGAATATNGAGAVVPGIPTWLGTFGAVDRVNSGRQLDVGINWIFSACTWMQSSYTRWNGEAGSGGAHPDANIVRAQLQLLF